MSKAKFLISISLIFLAFTFNSFAQDDNEQINLTGKWALQFQITENFTLSNFDGMAFSGKFHFTDNSAIRTGVDFSTYSSDSEYSNESVLPDTSIFSDESMERGETNIRINLQYLHYANLSNSISMFIGAGVSFLGSPAYQRNVNNENNLEKISFSNSGYGADLIIGVEWFVRSNIGISAEYNSGYLYRKSKTTFTLYEEDNINDEINEENYLQQRTITNTYSSFSNHRVKFGVSVYF